MDDGIYTERVVKAEYFVDVDNAITWYGWTSDDHSLIGRKGVPHNGDPDVYVYLSPDGSELYVGRAGNPANDDVVWRAHGPPA